MRTPLALILILLTPACASVAHAGPMSEAERGRLIFQNHCALCHDDSAYMINDNGPALFGVVGRKVGSVPDYAYTPAMQKAGKAGHRWSETRLDRLLRNPPALYEGTAMPMNFDQAADRRAIIAYLKTLRSR